jgi:hypothetical protein
LPLCLKNGHHQSQPASLALTPITSFVFSAYNKRSTHNRGGSS